jgi:hypothetical protein
MFALWSSVYLHSHSMWSKDRWMLQKGHSELLTPSILGPWIALVYPVLSLDIATCFFLGIPFVSSFLSMSSFLSFISLFPFFHLWSLFLKSSSVNHYFRLSGGYLDGWYILLERFFRCLIGLFFTRYSLVTGDPSEGNSRSFMNQHLSDSLCRGVLRWCAAFSCHYRVYLVSYYHYFCYFSPIGLPD